MKMPEALLSENSRVIVSISTLLFVIGFAITATFTFTTWKTQTDDKQTALDLRISELDEKNKEQHKVLEDSVQILKVDSENNRADMAEIKTDLKWIIMNLQETK